MFIINGPRKSGKTTSLINGVTSESIVVVPTMQMKGYIKHLLYARDPKLYDVTIKTMREFITDMNDYRGSRGQCKKQIYFSDIDTCFDSLDIDVQGMSFHKDNIREITKRTFESDRDIVAVDFDGTLFETDYPTIKEPNLKLINHLKERREKKEIYLILWTCRCDEPLRNAVAACAQYGLYFDAINDNLPHMIEFFGSNSRKIFANEYIDDRNGDMGDYI